MWGKRVALEKREALPLENLNLALFPERKVCDF